MDSSSPPHKWISYLEHGLLAEDLPQPDAFFWCHQNNSSHSAENDDSSRGDSLDKDKSCSKKRPRDECSSGAGIKACREKMRRDKLNDRFMELSAVLEPDKPPKMDKASILRDAARILGQLRAEAQQLKDTNHQLQETVKELKAEKIELRDEKLSLKLDKERLERQLKNANVIPSYLPHPVAVHAAVAAYSSQNQPHSNKSASVSAFPFSTTMSHWMPPSTVDISNDHVLRPPVA